MSLSEILGSATSGLAAAQAGLRTVSNNIANVGVAGYAREKVSLATRVHSGGVSGVVIGEPQRIADRFLEASVYQRGGDFGRADVTSSYLDRLQSLLGQPGDASSLPAKLDSISASAIALTGSPGSAQTVASFTGNVQDAISSMQQLNGDVTNLRGDVESEVGTTVDRINGLLSQINDLNGTVSQQVGQGRSTSGAADQRTTALTELSSLVAITVRDQPDGRVSIETASGATLLDRRLRQLSYAGTGSGDGAQAAYPPIDIRFADPGGASPATGERIETAAAGGKLGGLLDLRDRALPHFQEQLGTVFSGMAEALNSVSNAGTTVPAPTELDGRQTGLVGGDRLGFTGSATFAVLGTSGKLVASTTIDFSSLGAGATVNDAVTAINAGLGGAATASFTGGVLTLKAAGGGNGVAIAQTPGTPSDRAGIGFSQFFGMNDLVRSDTSMLTPTGFTASDPHGFGAGETANIVLRDVSGRALTSYTLTGSVGPTIGDLVTELNASPLSKYGSFALDQRGRVEFSPLTGLSGAVLSVPSDSTNRFGSGVSFSSLSGLTGATSGLGQAKVRGDINVNPNKLPLAMLDTTAAVGTKAVGAGDIRGATGFVDRLAKTIDLGKDGVVTLDHVSSALLGGAGLQASQAKTNLDNATSRRDDAINRRDSFSGVNIDEELSQMVVLQSSYSASARVISTASSMYDTLLAMIR
ncbi:flagellar hook-associated protein 1 FlgK [Sphingomonas sp. BE270]|jgi:flagellar hook-associated protein 1 FlgK|uniref:flagellar hook-associated protein FlgK n=1 Tax=unclassified Sphingomonas TaxID=196159 RepID=UPI0010F8B7A9|nr:MULTISPECIES: flagellar basal body rod C-terminal domain-containing protein [unclassified Sphingomonas]MDR6848579.1 flagellar hook-associated protein 1 FlgK [Sphingomonas sp. BE137]MDR7255860.1 flagellar hook-associated protein 1 FlgK [Sphingomonas sp. BE270]